MLAVADIPQSDAVHWERGLAVAQTALYSLELMGGSGDAQKIKFRTSAVAARMTLGMAWVRNLGSIRELVVASDSRLSGGKFWDSNPKIMLLPRSDAVLSFAGDTHDAYPLMLQVYNAILMHGPALDRSMDLAHLKGHLVRVINKARSSVTNLPRGERGPVIADATFMLSGYSWLQKRFRVWTLHYHKGAEEFTFRPTQPWRGQAGHTKEIAFVGDERVVKAAKIALVDRLRAKGKLTDGGLDMEPLEVLRDLLRSQDYPEIGGAPQVVKIYEHMNAHPFPVHWPDASGGLTVLGRPLMPYETFDSKAIDPDAL